MNRIIGAYVFSNWTIPNIYAERDYNITHPATKTLITLAILFVWFATDDTFCDSMAMCQLILFCSSTITYVDIADR